MSSTVCRVQLSSNNFRKLLTDALSVLERNVFLMTMPPRPPALSILMKCWRNRKAVSPVRIGKFC